MFLVFRGLLRKLFSSVTSNGVDKSNKDDKEKDDEDEDDDG